MNQARMFCNGQPSPACRVISSPSSAAAPLGFEETQLVRTLGLGVP